MFLACIFEFLLEQLTKIDATAIGFEDEIAFRIREANNFLCVQLLFEFFELVFVRDSLLDEH